MVCVAEAEDTGATVLLNADFLRGSVCCPEWQPLRWANRMVISGPKGVASGWDPLAVAGCSGFPEELCLVGGGL